MHNRSPTGKKDEFLGRTPLFSSTPQPHSWPTAVLVDEDNTL
jgi:hypothetical protein